MIHLEFSDGSHEIVALTNWYVCFLRRKEFPGEELDNQFPEALKGLLETEQQWYKEGYFE